MNGPDDASPAGENESAHAIRTAGNSYPLPGYERRVLERAEVVAREPLIDALSRVLSAHGSLYEWASSLPQPVALRGRAPVYVATLPHTDVTMVVRHSWHGGLLAPITRDLYFVPTRAPIELLRTFMLRGIGVAVPEFLAFVLYPAGPGLRRVDVATRLVPDAFDFGAVLAELAPGISRGEAYDAVLALLVKLSAFGFTHPDLNVKNVLLSRSDNTLMATVIDVDVVQWSSSQAPSDVMLANAARLSRSMRKWRTRFGIALTDAELNGFVQRAIDATPPRSASLSASATTTR